MKKNVRSTDWLIAGVPPERLASERILAILGAKINIKRNEMGMDQKSFAKYMGVTQGLVSRWESGNYNFTVSNLASICRKLDLDLDISIKEPHTITDFVVLKDNKTTSEEKWSVWNYNPKIHPIGGAA